MSGNNSPPASALPWLTAFKRVVTSLIARSSPKPKKRWFGRKHNYLNSRTSGPQEVRTRLGRAGSRCWRRSASNLQNAQRESDGGPAKRPCHSAWENGGAPPLHRCASKKGHKD